MGDNKKRQDCYATHTSTARSVNMRRGYWREKKAVFYIATKILTHRDIHDRVTRV